MRILGIDPGSRLCGIGIIEFNGSKYQLVEHQVIKLKQEHMEQRLAQIMREVGSLIDEYKPETCALEQAFVKHNVHTALVLGQVRGVIMAVVANAGIDFNEYAPRTIKKAVSGDGAADKSQVQKMIKILLNLDYIPPSDAADALAVAICHANHRRNVLMPNY